MGGRKYCSSFIKLRHGDNDVELFNPDCSMRLLIDSIRKKCNCPTSRNLAVAEETLDTTIQEMTFSEVTELSENMDNGRPYFSDRGSYVLLSVQRKGDHLEYEPLLDEEHRSQALKDKLHVLNNPKAELRRPTRTSRAKPPSRNESRAGRKTSTVYKGKLK